MSIRQQAPILSDLLEIAICGQIKLDLRFRWEPNTYGYHGDDGRKYCYLGSPSRSNNTGTDFGPTYGTGDTVGAGLNFESQEIFFTYGPMHRPGIPDPESCSL